MVQQFVHLVERKKNGWFAFNKHTHWVELCLHSMVIELEISYIGFRVKRKNQKASAR
jgi:hypothetical protein